jgi:hypothetical protein
MAPCGKVPRVAVHEPDHDDEQDERHVHRRQDHVHQRALLGAAIDSRAQRGLLGTNVSKQVVPFFSKKKNENGCCKFQPSGVAFQISKAYSRQNRVVLG